MKKLFDEIKKETNLNVYPLTTVSRRISRYARKNFWWIVDHSFINKVDE